MANNDISSSMPNYDPSANPPYDENSPIVFEINQYVGEDNVVYSNYTNLLFISGQLERDERFSKYCNSNTYPIVYDYQLDGDSIMEFIQNFTNVKRIAFAFHGPKTEYTELPFINIGPLFSTDDLSNTPDNLSENVLFVKGLIQQFSLENIDFLGCKVLLYNEWKQYLDLLQNDSLVIGASDDDTGNIKYGGDWIMENTMENVQHIYFNEDLNNYAELLTDSDSSVKLVPHQVDLPFTYNGVTYTVWGDWIDGFSYTKGINYNSSIYTQSRLLPGDNQYYNWGNVFDGGIIRGGNGIRQYWNESSYRGFIKFPYYIVWKLDGLKTVNKVVIYSHYEGKDSAPKKFDIISSTVNMTIPTANVTTNPGALKNDSNWNVIQTVEETVPYVNGWVTNDNGTTTTDNKTYTFPSTEAKFIGIKIYTHMSSSSLSGRLEEIVFYGGPASPDTEVPVITLTGPSTITQDVGYNYIENNATAVDSRDGNLTSSIVITGNLDTTTAGTYEVKYNVSDAAGNEAIEVIRTVIVNAIPPLPTFSAEWHQLGGDIIGEAAGDYSGSAVAISSDGSIVAIGARYNDGNGTESGHVRVYQRDSNKTVEVTDQNSASFGPVGWTRLGQDIDGVVAGDRSTHVNGLSISGNGTIIAIGLPLNDTGSANAGTVIVYQYDNTNNNWNQLGQDIYGEAAGDYSGYTTSLSSDGSIVAIGAHSNDGNGSQAGHVRVYQYTNNTWSQLGQDMDGELAADYSGGKVSLSSNGTVLAISAHNNDGNGNQSGQVRVYQYTNNTWSRLGGDIDGEAEGDQAGRGVSLSSDGSIVAIGAPYNDGNANAAGHVRVYQRDTYKTVAVTDQNNSSFGPVGWTRLGQDIDGDVENDTAGTSVSLSSNGSILAVGVPGYNRITGSQAGRAKVYQYDNPNNTWNQVGDDIIGDADKDYFGYRIELSSNGTILVVGGQFNDDNGTDSGHVRVYSIIEAPPVITLNASTTLTILAGDNYTDAIPTASDDRDGDLTSSIVTTGSVDPTTPGIYTVKYNVSDAAGNNATEVVRTVTVNALPPPPIFGTEWYQLGGDIDGEAAGDYFGSVVVISSDGSIVAVGSRYNDGNGADSGHVRVYQRDSNKTVEVTDQNSASFGPVGWTRLGQDIDGVIAGDKSTDLNGLSLSSDGSIVAVGANYNDTSATNAGIVIVYQYDNTNNNWNQLGQDIYGEAEGDYSGYSTALSGDGSIIAIGAHSNDGNGNRSGHVRVYQYTNNTWSQLGQDIDGEMIDDYSGINVSLSSDGTVLAISAHSNDGNGSSSGHVRVYQYTSSGWTQLGGDIDGEAAGDQSGRGLSLSSDGSIVAIGAPFNEINGADAGHVRVYQRDSNKTVAVTDQNSASFGPVGWTRLGQDIDSDIVSAYFGWRVSLSSDGTILAISLFNAATNGPNAGSTRVFKYDNPNNTWNQIGNDIIAEAEGDRSGYSVALSSDGSIVAIGAPYNDENGTESGHVRVYSIIETPAEDPDTEAPVITLNASTTLTITAGDSYTDAIPTASDNIDGDLTSSIVTTGSVDPNTPGTYEVKYNVSDAAGNNATEVIRTVTVTGLDVTPPVITLNASTTLIITAGDSYTDAIPSASDDRDGDLTSSIVTTGSVDPTTPGIYTVKYNVSDAAGNNANEVVRTVNVIAPDVRPPITRLKDENPINLNLNETYTEYGATSYDERYGDVTNNIVITGSVDTTTPGIYEIKYNVSDPIGNAAIEVVRTVNVVQAPIITLNGQSLVSLEIGDTYTELNATAVDSIDGDITNNIVITSNVDTLSQGTYAVRYNVSNSNESNAIEIIRTVIVVEPIGSVDIETLTTAVPTIEVTDSDTVSIPTFSDKTILTSGTPSEKIAKRKLFMKEFFTKNLRKVSDKKVKMSKEDLLGETSVIAKAELVIQKAENTEVPVDLSNLSEDEGIYTYMDRIGDFAVLEISPGKKIKVEKMNETQYKIYEDYENESSPVTKIMNEGETGTYSGFGYQIGSFSGPTDPGLLSTPICFPAGTQVTTDQGDINIEMLIKNVNTIDGKRIVDITETAPIFKYLIHFEKDSLGNNIPSKNTEMSPDHRMVYEGILMKASDVAEKCENVYPIPFIQEKLYNVLMEKHDTMMINNLCCETLNPDNILVHITNDDTYDIHTKQKLLHDYNTLLMNGIKTR